MSTNAALPTVDRLKAVLLATFGGTSGGLSVFGAVHGVCHATCQGLVAAAAFAGISLVGMPLAFLLDPRWTLGFAAMGVAPRRLETVAKRARCYRRTKESAKRFQHLFE